MLCTFFLVILLLFLYMYPANLPHLVLYVWFFMFSVCSSAVVIMAFTAAKELFPIEIFGGAVFLSVLGKVLDIYGRTDSGVYPAQAFSMVLLILLISSIISLLCTFLMKETYRR